MPRIFGIPLSKYFPPIVLCLMAIGYLLLSRQYEEQSRLVPTLIGITMLVLTSLDIISRSDTLLGRALLNLLNPAAFAEQSHKALHNWKEAGYVLWISVFAFGIIWVGIFVAVPTFLFLSLSLIGRRPVVQSIILAVAVSAAIWGLFSLLLRLQLFPGLLFGGQL